MLERKLSDQSKKWKEKETQTNFTKKKKAIMSQGLNTPFRIFVSLFRIFG
jgi:hypothetical protein